MTQTDQSSSIQKVTRRTQLRKLLSRKSGVTIAQLQDTFGWQPHTARAAISGLRKSGDLVERNKSEHGCVYRIDLGDIAQ